jgi:hypothetical protein
MNEGSWGRSQILPIYKGLRHTLQPPGIKRARCWEAAGAACEGGNVAPRKKRTLPETHCCIEFTGA